RRRARRAAVLQLHARVSGCLRGGARRNDRVGSAARAARRAPVARRAVERRAMSTAEEKRYDATPARRERARREGNAARSSEVNGIVAFGAALLAAAAAVPLATA